MNTGRSPDRPTGPHLHLASAPSYRWDSRRHDFGSISSECAAFDLARKRTRTLTARPWDFATVHTTRWEPAAGIQPNSARIDGARRSPDCRRKPRLARSWPVPYTSPTRLTSQRVDRHQGRGTHRSWPAGDSRRAAPDESVTWPERRAHRVLDRPRTTQRPDAASGWLSAPPRRGEVKAMLHRLFDQRHPCPCPLRSVLRRL